MNRYIDADRVHRDCEMRFADTGVPYEWAYALTIIDHAPTADVAPVVHAIWKNCGEGDGDWYCTNCKQWQTFDEFGDLHPKDDYGYYYCPNCGAKMDGEDDSNNQKGAQE